MQVQVPIGNLPVQLVCDAATARVAFVRVADFPTIFCRGDTGYCDAVFDMDGFSIDGTDFSYNTLYEYKQIPVMLLWLQGQNLQNPLIQ